MDGAEDDPPILRELDALRPLRCQTQEGGEELSIPSRISHLHQPVPKLELDYG